jgi:hypothetical protein
VVVGWNSTQVGGGLDLLAQTMAHEAGHYLGLWHVQESQPPCSSLSQTGCSAFGSVDPITDTPTGNAGTSYLMFWQTDGSNTTVSRGEGIVMRSSVLVQ